MDQRAKKPGVRFREQVRSRAMRIIALVFALSTPALAADLQALVLTGATTEAAAKPLLDKIQRQVAAVSRFVAFPEGFPRLVPSASLQGLKPGFFIVLGGLCESAEMLDALKALDAGAYAKAVEADAAACPKMVGWAVAETVLARDADKRGLRAVLFDGSEEGWSLFTSLRDKAGVEIDARVFTQSSHSSCMSGGKSSLRVRGAEVHLEDTDCLMMRGCPNPGEGSSRSVIRATGNTIGIESTVTVSPGYRGCRGE